MMTGHACYDLPIGQIKAPRATRVSDIISEGPDGETTPILFALEPQASAFLGHYVLDFLIHPPSPHVDGV